MRQCYRPARLSFLLLEREGQKVAQNLGFRFDRCAIRSCRPRVNTGTAYYSRTYDVPSNYSPCALGSPCWFLELWWMVRRVLAWPLIYSYRMGRKCFRINLCYSLLRVEYARLVTQISLGVSPLSFIHQKRQSRSVKYSLSWVPYDPFP